MGRPPPAPHGQGAEYRLAKEGKPAAARAPAGPGGLQPGGADDRHPPRRPGRRLPPLSRRGPAMACGGGRALCPCHRPAPPPRRPVRGRGRPGRRQRPAGARSGAGRVRAAAGGDGKADALAGQVGRAIVDLAEAVALEGREGEKFEAVVTDVDQRGARIQLCSSPVVARLKVDGMVAGQELAVRLDSADPATRSVQFSVES